ncbi:hypothetical protein [Bacillus sp. Marseille-Q1617]|uniref:hypothetical protein n=1 Tax=Bacillus sp. Marseille-Q1617 TaxID=2736887 RepID=UPI001588933E|nr:hypothetical protein [Bacillus sp. Marseille-Q1617]
MKRNANVNAVIFVLFFLLIIHVIRIILHAKIYIVYSMGVGPLFLIGLIIFLIVLLYFKG